MRQRFETQLQLGPPPIEGVVIPHKSRDELPPILAGLQWIFTTAEVNEQIFALLEEKIIGNKQATGRPGMDLWHILVLGVVRLGLDCDFDRLEHVANYDYLVRALMGLPGIEAGGRSFHHKTLSENAALIDEQVLAQINQIVVTHGHRELKKSRRKTCPEDRQLRGGDQRPLSHRPQPPLGRRAQKHRTARRPRRLRLAQSQGLEKETQEPHAQRQQDQRRRGQEQRPTHPGDRPRLPRQSPRIQFTGPELDALSATLRTLSLPRDRVDRITTVLRVGRVDSSILNELLPTDLCQRLHDLLARSQAMSAVGDAAVEWTTTQRDLVARLLAGERIQFTGPELDALSAALRMLSLPRERVDAITTALRAGQVDEEWLAEAEKRNWLLFFDEADALFGKRTATQSSHDRYANQEVSYLLQRVEDFAGAIVLASNFKGNMDDAFVRRFQSMIAFSVPNADQRLQLWNNAFANGFGLSEDCDLDSIADEFELTGGEIVNVVRTIAIRAAQRGDSRAAQADFIDAIRKEYQKEGRILGGSMA